MLSRVANSIYWMSRYVERADNVARFIDVNLNLILDADIGLEQQWQPLVNTSGDHELFAEHYGMADEENVVRFLAFDHRNPNSILSCLKAARENARTIREIISSPMWEQLNEFYLYVKDVAQNPNAIESLSRFFDQIHRGTNTHAGLTSSTLTHDEPWHFSHLGRMLERADKISRILDVKYFILLRSPDDVGTAFDDIQWSAVLQSASAFEMYRKRYGRITPKGIVEFLLLNREFPRAARFCLDKANDSLHAISGSSPGQVVNQAEKRLGQLCSEVTFTSVEEIIDGGLHEYLDRLQTQLNQVGESIFTTFFAVKTPVQGNQGQRPQAQE